MSFKQLTPENWLEPDPVSSLLVRFHPERGVEPLTAEHWVRAFLAIELPNGVPAEIRELFAAARGLMVYGWFYYPIYALADEQLARVAEAAAVGKCHALGLGANSFDHAIAKLVSAEVISPRSARSWHSVRALRNRGSHPRIQAATMQPDALAFLRMIKQLITALWEPESGG